MSLTAEQVRTFLTAECIPVSELNICDVKELIDHSRIALFDALQQDPNHPDIPRIKNTLEALSRDLPNAVAREYARRILGAQRSYRYLFTSSGDWKSFVQHVQKCSLLEPERTVQLLRDEIYNYLFKEVEKYFDEDIYPGGLSQEETDAMHKIIDTEIRKILT